MHIFDAEKWTKALFETVPRRFTFEVETEKEFSEGQGEFRKRFREILGFPVIKQRGCCSLNPEQEEKVDLGDYTREKWWITVEPDFRVPFYLLCPNETTSPRPLVLAIHGHNRTGKELYVGIWQNEEEKRQITEGERDIAVQAVKEGYICIVPDMRGFGELRRSEDQKKGRGFCHTLQMHDQLFGRTLMGDRVWDVTRLIDYARSRPEVDENRIAITGLSGGGTVSLFAAALGERIKVTVPCCCFGTMQCAIGSIDHCVCNFVPGMLQLGEKYDIAGLIAPRPLLIIAGKKDRNWPYEGVQFGFKKLSRIYRLLDAEERCELYTGEGGHRYYKKEAWSFIRKWL